MNLGDLNSKMRNCTSCPLSEGRTNVVPGEGQFKRKILFLGEGPGRFEDESGRPFIGRAGRLLTKLIEGIGLSREKDVYITNIVKCRPPDNRNPNKLEISTCRPLWLDKQLEILEPEIIVILGNVALQTMLPKTKLGEVRGAIIEKDGRKFFPTYHPSAALRFVKWKVALSEDFGKLKSVIGGKL